MGVRRIVEVLDHAPDELTSAERLVLVVIAENVNDDDRARRTWPNFSTAVLARRSGLGIRGLRAALGRLAGRGLECRVVIAAGKDGRPLYAVPGHQVTYRLPHLQGGTTVPPFVDNSADAGQVGGTVVPPTRHGDAQDHRSEDDPQVRQGGTDASSDDRSMPPSAPDDTRRNARSKPYASEDPQVRQGGMDRSSGGTTVPPFSSPLGTPLSSPEQRAVRAAGVVAESDEREFIDWITETHQPRGPGWWKTVAGNGDLAALAEQWRAAGRSDDEPPRPPWCGECDERTRLLELDDGRPARCRRCHPLIAGAASIPGGGE